MLEGVVREELARKEQEEFVRKEQEELARNKSRWW